MDTNYNNSEIGNLAANTIRFLAADAVEKANSGHPGMPMGMADCAYVLWSQFLRFNPEDPNWPGRDRFILSAGHGSTLLYSMLHLCGYDVSLEDLKNFRQLGSKTPGHPEYGCAPGVEMTTGPLGQGFAAGVGMAIAAKMTAARLNRETLLFGTHRIFGIVSDGDLMEGVASEAASLAGHLKLGNIIYFYDDNKISIEGSTNLTFSESVAKRFEAYGWQVIQIDGHNHQEIADALEKGISDTDRPTLIKARTHIGFGAPNKQDTAGVHGAPLGEEELRAAKENMGWSVDKSFYIPEEVLELFAKQVSDLSHEYNQWMDEYSVWKLDNPDLSRQTDSDWVNETVEKLSDDLMSNIPCDSAATRKLSGAVMQKIADYLPGFCGGSADLSPSTNTFLKSYNSIQANHFDGRNLHFGIREHAMGAILNGMALYGGIIPFGATFLQFADYMRPPIRLAAMMGLQVVYVFTHDSIFLGEDGPTHQPVEHLAALRTIPNLTIIRPADAAEVAGAWILALKNKRGPTALILTRQKVPALKRPAGFSLSDVYKGAYIIAGENSKKIDLILVSSGSELQLALKVSDKLKAEGYSVRVVSMPSMEIFRQQSKEYQELILSQRNTKVVVIEACSLMGWGDLIRAPMLKIGIEEFGKSAPYEKLAEEFGFTPETITVKVKNWLDRLNSL
ncbi:MAG: transketolase [Candidatus Marinimicrobia bacterium]|nr:transketolase [Candidatus Neomarinimicrobiota bacterium]